MTDGGPDSLRERGGAVAHLRSAVGVAVLLALCQAVAATLVGAWRAPGAIGLPVFFDAQAADFCVKLLGSVGAGQDWLRGGALDRFLASTGAGKLAVAPALVGANLAVLAPLGLAIGLLRWVLRRRASAAGALAWLLAVGLVVHGAALVLAVSVPKSWTVAVLLKSAARVVLREGAGVALLGMALGGGAATVLARGLRLRVAIASAGIAAALLAAAGARAARPLPETASSARVPDAAPAQVRNVLLISIDSLRADRVGCYGNERDTSPTLDRLARAGTRFTEAMSTTSWTLPAHVTMMTGRDVLSHGVIGATDRLSAAVPTLAESLHAAGVETAGIVAAEFLKGTYGFDRGFDHYDDASVPASTWFAALGDQTANRVADLAIGWLRERPRARFFLFLHFWDVHYDYVPPAPYDTMFDPEYRGAVTGSNFMRNPAVRAGMDARDLEHLLALYDGEVRWVDDQIARVLAALAEAGLAESTALLVTSDHGDEFFEHGGKGHQRTLYREVVHVPLIVRVPGLPASPAVDAPVSLADLMPTVLGLFGVEPPAGIDGRSLLPLVAGGRAPQSAAVRAFLCNPRRGTPCKAMRADAAGALLHSFQPARLEFFAAADREQRRNLAAETGWRDDGRLDRMTAEMNARWEAYRRAAGRPGYVEMDDAARERLRVLGYAD